MSHRDVMDELAPSAHPVYNAAPTQSTWAHNLIETNERIKKTLHSDVCQTRFGPPPPGASSVAYRSQSELPQCCGLCRSHTFTYAKNLLELPHLQTKSALPSRLHRRKLSTRLHPKCQLPTLLLAGESVRLGILLLHALRRPLILSISRQYT